jgi:hypothetical protein
MTGIRTSRSTTLGPQRAHLLHGLRAVGRLSGHGDAGLGGQDRGERFPDHRLVVGDQAPDHRAVRGRGHAGAPVGSSAATSKPPSGTGPAENVPPSSATRSRMPARPCPCPLAAPNPVPAVGRCPAAAWAGIIWHADGVVQVTGSGLAPGQRVVVPST